MKPLLGLLFVAGIVSVIIGAVMWAGLQPDLDKVPAIVIVPQIISAELVIGFGALVCAICGAGLGVIHAVEASAAGIRVLLPPNDVASTQAPVNQLPDPTGAGNLAGLPGNR